MSQCFLLFDIINSSVFYVFQDPAMSQMMESFSNPVNKDQLEERIARVKEDPSLKPILEDIESGGPAAMMRLFPCIFNFF